MFVYKDDCLFIDKKLYSLVAFEVEECETFLQVIEYL